MAKNGNKGVSKISIPKLILEMNNNKVCLPSFQRDFVWNPEQMAKLVESVVRHFPIGTFLFLDYGKNKDIGKNSFVDSIPNSFEPAHYVIDGQQRMRTFYKLLNPPNKFEPNAPLEHNNRSYKIYLKIRTNVNNLSDRVDKPTFIITKQIKEEERDDYELQGKEGLIPIEFILKKHYIKKWTELARKGVTKKSIKQITQNLFQISAKIKSYKCLIEKVNMKLKPKDHANMFRLLNEAGTDLTIFDLMVAQLHPYGINLRKLWNESNKQFKIFQEFNLDPIYILKVLLLIKKTKLEDKNPTCTKRDLRAIDRYYCNADKQENEFKLDWHKACKYTSKALEDIKYQHGAYQKKYIPYTPMIITLAAIKWWIDDYKHYKERYKGGIRAKLEQWYWGAIFDNSYEKSSDNVISKHYSALRRWLTFGERQRRPSEISYSFNRKMIRKIIRKIESPADARYKAILCLPMINVAQDLYSHDFLSNKTLHDHHIFPKRSKEAKKLSAEEVNSVVNRMLITEETNKEILNKSPNDYLSIVDKRILTKHFLFKSIVEDNLSFKEFIDKRRQLIVERLYSLLR